MRDAVLDGASRRLRPILMTALATIFALVPMATGLTGHSGFISQPLAIVVIGGLVSSTVLTLIVLPTLYYLVEGRRERRDERRRGGAPSPCSGVGRRLARRVQPPLGRLAAVVPTVARHAQPLRSAFPRRAHAERRATASTASRTPAVNLLPRRGGARDHRRRRGAAARVAVPGARRSRRSGRSPTDVAASVLTHAHFDHLGFARRMQAGVGRARLRASGSSGRSRPIPIGTRTRTRGLLYPMPASGGAADPHRDGGGRRVPRAAGRRVRGSSRPATCSTCRGASVVVFTPGPHLRPLRPAARGAVRAALRRRPRDPRPLHRLHRARGSSRARPPRTARRRSTRFGPSPRPDADRLLPGHGDPWRAGAAARSRAAAGRPLRRLLLTPRGSEGAGSGRLRLTMGRPTDRLVESIGPPRAAPGARHPGRAADVRRAQRSCIGSDHPHAPHAPQQQALRRRQAPLDAGRARPRDGAPSSPAPLRRSGGARVARRRDARFGADRASAAPTRPQTAASTGTRAPARTPRERGGERDGRFG